MCIDLYSWQAHHSVYTNLHKFIQETLWFPHSRGSEYSSTQSSICSPLRSHPQSVELEYSRSAPVLQVFHRVPNTVVEASSVRASQPRCFQSWIHSMKSLHGLAQIALHWTEGWTKGLPVRSRGWLNSRIPLVCSSQHVACVWTVWFPLSAPVARAVVTMSVSEWSDALWRHGQPNS